MMIVMKNGHSKAELEQVTKRISDLGFKSHIIPGEHSVAIGITGNGKAIDPEIFTGFSGVLEAIQITRPYKLSSREFKSGPTTVKVGDAIFGQGHFAVIAGPCAVESRDQTLRIARQVKKMGAQVLRGGAYKPRSSPYSFQGLGIEGLKILDEARKETGLPFTTEAVDVESLKYVAEYSDIIQIGARNMQNFTLLTEAGKCRKPVLLKRGMSATVEEWLQAAEYILDQGNAEVILCERGVRSFDQNTRNMVDLAVVPVLHSLSHLPVIVDPSHATGRRTMIAPVARAALAVGAQGVMMDVHDRPKEALCDGPQAILPEEFGSLNQTLHQMAKVMGVEISSGISTHSKGALP